LGGELEPEQVESWVRSASLLHSDGDAMDIAVADGKIVGVRGRAEDRVNRGRLGPKDLFGWQANNAADRLTRPLVREGDRLVETDWDTAMGRIVSRSQELLAESGPGSIAFYTTGQLFIEDYYTLAVIARAGIGTNHVDGNTRLCTATADESLKQSFGCDGQPGSYTDFDYADTIALFGHNVAETQPVLRMRMLDRLDGPDAPRLLVVDPRRTVVAAHAAVHLAPLPGTNVALMNALFTATGTFQAARTATARGMPRTRPPSPIGTRSPNSRSSRPAPRGCVCWSGAMAIRLPRRPPPPRPRSARTGCRPPSAAPTPTRAASSAPVLPTTRKEPGREKPQQHATGPAPR
jgi:hypothetical protein